jgi:hypothetical protein
LNEQAVSLATQNQSVTGMPPLAFDAAWSLVTSRQQEPAGTGDSRFPTDANQENMRSPGFFMTKVPPVAPFYFIVPDRTMSTTEELLLTKQ